MGSIAFSVFLQTTSASRYSQRAKLASWRPERYADCKYCNLEMRKMTKGFLPSLLLISLQLGDIKAQEKVENEKVATPIWYLDPTLTGGFTERSTECGQNYAARKSEASDGPILIPANTPADICINFPSRTKEDGTEIKGGWRHDRGAKGDCANGCCEFNPPISNIQPKQQPSWFFTLSDCTDTAGAITAPILFHGKEKDQKTVCILNKSGAFELKTGFLGGCGSGCCLFFGPGEEKAEENDV